MRGDKYECIRCGYNTCNRAKMRRHFYETKKTCPGTHNTIDLTDAIKEHILSNRIYKIPKDNATTNIMFQQINYNNTMNNFLNNIAPITKVQKWTEHTEKHLIAFESTVENKYIDQKKNYERGKGDLLTTDDLLEIFDNVTRCYDDDYNLLYDSSMNKINMFESGEWLEMFMKRASKKVIKTIKDYFWDAYEAFLIRTLTKPNRDLREQQKVREALEVLYSFLACFDMLPVVIEQGDDNKLLYNADDDEYWESGKTELSEEYSKMFNKIRDTIDVKKFKADVKEILMRNAKKNVHELNQTVLALMSADDDFKQKIMSGVVAPPAQVITQPQLIPL